MPNTVSTLSLQSSKYYIKQDAEWFQAEHSQQSKQTQVRPRQAKNNIFPKIMTSVYFALLAVLSFSVSVNAHGRLLQPPSRSSMWRYKDTDEMLIPYSDKIQSNYQDNELNCGGRANQIEQAGKCGVCGDPYNSPVKENEAGGKYALGIITRNFEMGQTIDVTVEITAEHKGFFEFRLCPWNDVDAPITQECLDRYLLEVNGALSWNLPEDPELAQATHNLAVKLPADVTCEQCVLQWRYHTGNSWGKDENGEGLGYGDQEEFYGCSDFAIQSDGLVPLATTTVSNNAVTKSTTEAPVTTTTETSSDATVTTTTTVPPPTTTTMARPEMSEPAPEIDCATATLGQPFFRDCHSFYICAHENQHPFEFLCAEGTVCDFDGRCKHLWDVSYPCGEKKL